MAASFIEAFIDLKKSLDIKIITIEKTKEKQILKG